MQQKYNRFLLHLFTTVNEEDRACTVQFYFTTSHIFLTGLWTSISRERYFSLGQFTIYRFRANCSRPEQCEIVAWHFSPIINITSVSLSTRSPISFHSSNTFCCNYFGITKNLFQSLTGDTGCCNSTVISKVIFRLHLHNSFVFTIFYLTNVFNFYFISYLILYLFYVYVCFFNLLKYCWFPLKIFVFFIFGKWFCKHLIKFKESQKLVKTEFSVDLLMDGHLDFDQVWAFIQEV